MSSSSLLAARSRKGKRQRSTGRSRRLTTTSASARPALHPERSQQQPASLPASAPAKARTRAADIQQSSSNTEPSNDPAHSQTLQQLLRYPTLFDPIRKPRHAIVLAHGLFGFDSWGLPYLPRFQYAYWHDVLHVLRNVVGAEVIVTNVPGAGAIKTRAAALHGYLSEKTPMRAVNILAHSMGGLDARYLLTHLQPTSYTPLSLTTLSTPHRGSDFMSWCGANIGVGGENLLSADPSLRRKLGKLPYSLRHPILSVANGEASHAEQRKQWSSMFAGLGPAFSGYLLKMLDSPAYSNLTPEYLERFNEQTPDREDIRYFSVSARVSRLGVWHPLWLPKVIMDAADEVKTREHGGRRSLGNDCLVSVESALWGEHLGIVDNCDHWDLRGSAGLRTAAAAAVQSAITEQELEEREKHREKLRRVYQRISDYREQPESAPNSGLSAAAGVAQWITDRIPFTEKSNTKRPDGSHKIEAASKPPPAQEKPLVFTTSKEPKHGTFNLEALYISLARKLYEEGL